jgi:hypothetical protein
MISRFSTITSSAGSPSRRTAVMVRVTPEHEALDFGDGDRAHLAGGHGPCGSRRGRCNTCTADRASAYGLAAVREYVHSISRLSGPKGRVEPTYADSTPVPLTRDWLYNVGTAASSLRVYWCCGLR